MCAASSQEKSSDRFSQDCGKDIIKPDYKGKKKTHSSEGTLPPRCPEPSCVLVASAAKPLFSLSSILKSVPSGGPSSGADRPHLIAKVGPGIAIGNTKWTQGPRLKASTLRTVIPVRTTQSTLQREKGKSVNATACKDKKVATVKDGSKPSKSPLTGTEVVQIFVQKSDLGDLKLYYLKNIDGDAFRPYDLRVVHSSEAGSEHYIFTPNTVWHVTQTGCGGVISLAEWYREYVLWTDLQKIPFLRNFRLQKAFYWWHKIIRKRILQQRSKNLHDGLLIAVPQFRNALHLLSAVIEELKEMHWLPLDVCKSYTLMEFKNALITKNQDCLQMLEKLSQCRTLILNMAKEDSYKKHQELQLQLKVAKEADSCCRPIHLLLAHQLKLQNELAQSESILKKLGNFAALVHQMIIQSLVTVIRGDAISFLDVLKRREQRSLFHTELCFSADNQLTVEPPIHLFKEAVSQALLTVGSSFIQKCEDCGFFQEVSSDVLISAQDLTFDFSDIKPYVNTVEKNIDGTISQVVRGMSAHWRILPKDAFRMLQVNMARGCYSPLSKTQLEWHIGINDITKEVEKEQAKIMQDVELEIQQLYESYAWMVDMHSFICQWSRASLESMRGQPASVYEENIKNVRSWAERLSAVDSSVSSSNWLFVIQCTHTKDGLGQQLRLIEEEVQEQLAEQIKMESEGLMSYLERATAELKIEPQDLHDFSKYAFGVRESLKVLPDLQKRLEYIHSLQNTICMNCRAMTQDEVTLEEKMLSLWDCFIPLLKKADSLVSHRLPSMANALDTMLSFLLCDLKNVISDSTSGSFLDPGQNAIEMVSKLNYMCMHANTLSAKLELLSRSSQDMQEHTMDLTIVTTNVQKLRARKELWELIAVYTTWLEEWKQLLFSEVVVSKAQDKVAKWKEQAQSLTTAIPTSDAVLQAILGYLESSSHQLLVLAKLQSPTLKEKHWRAILQDLGLHYKSEKKVTVADLMSQQLESHQKLIDKIYRGAQTECDMEQTFHKLCHRWKDRLFQLDVFTPTVWKHYLEVHFTETESSLMMLSTMLKSPYSVEFRLPLEDWIQRLQELEKLLVLLEKYQQKWAFLTKMLGGTFFSTQRKDLLKHFQPVDETFKEIMTSISKEPHVLNLVSTKTNDRFCGNSLFQVLLDGLSAMDVISNQMSDLLDNLCERCPRLWFLSEREVMQILSFQPTPFALQPFVQKCFKEVRLLEVACGIPRDGNSCEATSECHRQMKVLGVFGSLQEHIAFQCPLEPNADALAWFCDFEKQLKLTIVQLMKQCAVVRNQLEPSSQDLPCNTKARGIQLPSALPVLGLLSEYPLQCLLVVEKAVWCSVVLQAIQESSSVKFSNIKAHIYAKQKDLSHYISDGVTGSKSESQVSKYTMKCLRALLQLTMNHTQQLHRLMEVPCVRESSFEWLSLMKYYINSEENNDPTCYVDILGHHLQYSFEYCGPGEWEMVHTPSTDQAILGILVALTSYRCGLVSGPSMSGKKNTVIQLGKALGRQVVLKQCYPSMTPQVIQRILLGALQTGAWLVLNSVDLLTHNNLSILGQHLVDIHQSFTRLRRNTNERQNCDPEIKTVDEVTGCTNTVDSECHIQLAGKSISASLSYGCIIVSSKVHASGVPESLRFATRSIALTHPDYRIMAEVMLSAIGFSEAMFLSQRLVSFISLAQDSHCLPEFFSDNHSCFLVILQKIISASEIHFQQIVRERENSKKSKDSVEEHTDLTSLQNKPMKPFEEDGKKTEKASKSHRCYLTVVQSLMEEEAIVRAVLSVLLPDMKASQFYSLFKEAFPIACQFPLVQQYIEEDEKNQLEAAVREELQEKHFYCDADIICSALTLYQTMKSAQAVMLIGPSGSGKTTCYSALAGAFNSLAAKTVEERDKDNMIERGSPQAGQKSSVSNWSFVDTSVLFPSAMSHDELFGWFCEKRGWQDGALTKVLRDSERREHRCFEICNNEKKTDETLTVKWLVMDGEPVGQPCWLDYLTTLCSSQDAFLCLSSGETLLSQSKLKLLMEITDLCDASPSVVTRCSLVYFTGNDLWKSVWKREMNMLSLNHKLDHRIVKMWNHLGEDLFSSTLSLLGQRILTSAVHNERISCKSPTYGLQEISSFVRILRALLQHFGKEVEKPESLPHKDTRDIPPPATDAQSKQEQLSRNIFLLAYIWGFGGRLHSRHWPQFDLLARQVLFACRYKIVVPDEVSVFEHFFSFNSEMFSKDSRATGSVIPRYRKYTYLLNLMLEANQPVLVSGEPGSGKTTLCQTLLSFDKRHINLPASPLLSSRDLRTILNNIGCQKNCKDTARSMTKQPRLFLFVDDLHEAPCDAFGKASMALETLRQSISKGEILTFDTYNFKLLQSETISYLATCCISALNNPHSSVISPRLSCLFSIFVVDGIALDVVMAVYSPRLKFWLSEMPLNRHIGEDMALCIITATNELYHAVSDRFQPSMQRPHAIFSHHDLLKVFQGMYLWKSAISKKGKNENSQPALVLNIVQVWMHECMRTFSDRLCSEDDRKTVASLIAKTAATHYGMKLANEIDGVSEPAGQNPDTVDLPQELNQSHRQLTKPSENYRLHKQVLQHMEDKMATLVYGPDLSEALKLIKQQRNLKFISSYQEQDLDALVQKLCVLVDRKEDDKGHDCSITTKYIVHRERVSQLLHILRALLLPRGHGVLIGSDRGTGRKTTVRLAAHLTGYQLMEIHAGNENNLREILKEAGNQIRSDGVNVIILVHEEISQSVREELLLVMARSACPALYIDKELRNLVSRVTAVKHSGRYLMENWMFEKVLSQVHRNIHVFLLMPFTMSENSDITSKNEAQSWIAQIAKALRHSCCVEVYQPWSNQSLVEVADQCLKTSPHKMVQEHSEASLSVAMAGIHQSACQYASVLLRAQPFSPRTYMEFITHFGYLCSHLHKQFQDKTNRIAPALARLDALSNIAKQCKEHLISVQKIIAGTQQREKELLEAVEDHKKLFEEASEKWDAEENQLCCLEEQISHAQKQIKPVFLSGLQILMCLDPLDVEEVRHYRDPPVGVVKIMDAVCLLFNHPPGWESAKQLLSQADFFQELKFFDRYNLTNEQLQQLGQIVHSPQFVPESVREVSKACESLCRWVQAVYEYCCIQHRVLVKQQLEMQAAERRSRLYLAKQCKQEAYSCLEAVKLQLQCVQNELMEQLVQLHKAESAECEASACAGQLEMYVRDWRAAAQDTELRNQNMPGDALLLAAIISYLGHFGPETRTELLSKWRALCQTGSININPSDPRASLFTHFDTVPGSPSLGFPIPVTERLQLPLGWALGINEWQTGDALSPRLVVKLLLWGYRNTCIQRWPLLADNQRHMEMSFQNKRENTKLREEEDFGMVVCADDLELLHKLDQAAEKGLRVLVTHVERAVPSPQFLAKLARPTGCYFPGLNQPFQIVHPEFCLFLSTHLPIRLLNGGIHPSILAQVHVVDLSLSSEEIQDLMLTQLPQPECKELLIQHLQFQNYKQEQREKLATEEDALMDYILQSDTVLLQDPNFLPRVNVCQEVMKKLQDEIKQLYEQLEHHESLLAVPRHLMRLAAALYQALQAVSCLSPAYYFSLHGFITLMQEAFTGKDRIIGNVPGSIIQEFINTMVVNLLAQYRPFLFKSHAAVLKLLVSLALLQHNQLCSEGERVAFLRGLGDIEHPGTDSSSTTAVLPSWIPPHIHSDLLCLEKIPSIRGLIASLCASPIQWQEYLHFPSSTVLGAVPCRSHSHLSLLQRALLWKTMAPNCLEGLADAINACQLCLPEKITGTEAPLIGNPEAFSRYLVKHKRPIILTLPGLDGDMQTSVEPLCLINQVAKCVPGKKEVQVTVLSFEVLCDRELFRSMLGKAANDGHWLVFNNCHLLKQLDDEIVANLNQLVSSFQENPCLFHPGFQLWFITKENASHVIPAAVRSNALALVCDSPWDLKEELSCSLRQVAAVTQPQSGVTADNNLLLRCAIFHSVLVQRQSYKYLGQGRIYHWSQEDLHALVDAYIRVASLCHDKTKVLQYLAASLVYGGHVMDSADLEVVKSVAKTCFTTASCSLSSGPHILSKLVRNSGRSDLSGQLQVVEQGLWDSANISEPAVLGFSVDVAAEIIKVNSYNMNIFLQTSQTPLGTARCFSTKGTPLTMLPAFSHARDRLEGLKRRLTNENESAVANAGAVPHSPLRDFLQAEWDDLIDLVSLLLSQLQQPVQYSLTFACLSKLTDLSRLERRAELLSAYLWHHSTSDPPGSYRLSAFKNARGLLVAVMREAAKVKRKYITDIMLQFQVLSDSTYPVALPLDAVYLCGLELKGASWDTQLRALQDTVSPQSCSMPLLCVKAQVRSTENSQDTISCKSSYLMDTSNVQCAGVFPLTTPQVPTYHCPLYLDEGQESGNWGLADVNIITKVPLHSKLDPLLCSLRRVRLVSTL
ncbi:dynein heavy chain domain-containing protein 1 isoform X2 [Archocentrus centrarchus]|uniref:dynein heavy chain domain-containing protein 1 isoform X2 n=1 Tax=Archocentrus centrarchus TaxID=63155 RepID=UPI0011E9EBCA|nr:dynein heavy chain domain-containing protein 1 isoform X2 [Archocentrus centrarchus]